jgi:hypothetical protein
MLPSRRLNNWPSKKGVPMGEAKKKEYEVVIYRHRKWSYWLWLSEKGETPENGPWCIANNLSEFKVILDRWGLPEKMSFVENGEIKKEAIEYVKTKFEGRAATYEAH